MNYYRILLLSLCLLLTANVHGKIYKWTDENGQVQYSDKPPQNTLQTEILKTDKNTNKPIIITNDTNHAGATEGLPNSIILKIRHLFEQGKFDDINTILNQYQSRVESNIAEEKSLFQIYTAFDFNDESFESGFNQWIASKPNSASAYLARARYYYSLAWHSRGSASGSKTKQSQIDGMNAYFEKAKLDIDQAISISNHSVIPYYLLIGIGQGQGKDSMSSLALGRGLEISPASYIIRKHYMSSISPRWGGSLSKMESFARAAQVFTPRNPRLRSLLGYSTLEAGHILYKNNQYAAANKLFTKALVFGDESNIYFERGRSKYYQKEYQQALNDFDRAMDLYTEHSTYFYWHSKANEKLKRYNLALTDIKKSYLLNSNNKNTTRNLKRLLLQERKEKNKKVRNKKLSQALVSINSQLNNKPQSASLYFKKAKILGEQNKLKLASINLKKAIELEPGIFEHYLLMDLILFKQRKLREILKYWGEYLEIHPNDSRAYSERAGTYSQLRELDYAIIDSKKAVDLGNKEARVAYEKFMEMKRSGKYKK